MKENIPPEVSRAAALLGSKGGKVKGPSKRRDIDYAELGRMGGEAAGATRRQKRRKIATTEPPKD